MLGNNLTKSSLTNLSFLLCHNPQFYEFFSLILNLISKLLQFHRAMAIVCLTTSGTTAHLISSTSKKHACPTIAVTRYSNNRKVWFSSKVHNFFLTILLMIIQVKYFYFSGFHTSHARCSFTVVSFHCTTRRTGFRIGAGTSTNGFRSGFIELVKSLAK